MRSAEHTALLTGLRASRFELDMKKCHATQVGCIECVGMVPFLEGYVGWGGQGWLNGKSGQLGEMLNRGSICRQQ
jgi:hypothetical protein